MCPVQNRLGTPSGEGRNEANPARLETVILGITSRDDQMSRAFTSRKDHGFESGPRIFEPWSSQTNDFKIDTCCFLARRSALLG